MTTFYLVRHGLRRSHFEDTLLSDEGVRQAELTGAYLATKNIHQLVASPLERTQHTARIINSFLNVPLSTDNRLRERMEYEEARGSFDAFLAEWEKTMADRAHQPAYGNSAQVSGERIEHLLRDQTDGQNYVFISHGGCIGDVVRNLFSESEYPLTADAQKNLKWLDIKECSITEIVRDGDTYSLRRVGDRSHLVESDSISKTAARAA